MSHIDPAVQSRFDTLPADLQAEILSRKSELNSMSDLMSVLEQIVSGG